MKFLLLTYDPQGTDGPDVVPFDDEASAFAELKRATHAKQPREEVVLFHTDSIETLKQTHSPGSPSEGTVPYAPTAARRDVARGSADLRRQARIKYLDKLHQWSEH